MWHLLSDGKPWFAVKRHGYGAGPPIAWQGWLLLATYVAAMVGLGLLAENTRGMALAGVIVGMVVLSAVLVVIAKLRTERSWRWRWGDDD